MDMYTIAPYYWIIRPRQRVQRKPCNSQSRLHTAVQTNDRERSDYPTRRTGLNTHRVAARSPSPSPKKDHRIARSGKGTTPRSCAISSLMALPQAQPRIRHTDITCSSCPDSPRARGSLGCRQPHRIYVFTRIFGQCKPICAPQSSN